MVQCSRVRGRDALSRRACTNCLRHLSSRPSSERDPCIASSRGIGKVSIIDQDLRSEVPGHLFDLILCRYVALTYFATPLQRKVMARMIERLRPNGYFVIGAHEQLPGSVPELMPLVGEAHVFQKRAEAADPKLPD